jgi:hypothetical protein
VSKSKLKKIFNINSPFPFNSNLLKEIKFINILANINSNDDINNVNLLIQKFNENYPNANFQYFLYLGDNELQIDNEKFIILNDIIPKNIFSSVNNAINKSLNNVNFYSDITIYYNPDFFSPINYLLKFIDKKAYIGIGSEEYQNYFQLYFINNKKFKIDTIFDFLSKFK